MITRLVLPAVMLATLVGCASGSDDTAAELPAADVVATAPSDRGGLGDAIEVAAGAPAAADAGACGLERDVMTSAIEMYAVLVGTPPASEDDLIAEGLVVEPSLRFDVAADGTLVAAPGSPCS